MEGEGTRLASVLETVLAMPLQEMGMRPLQRALRRKRPAAPVDQGADTVLVIGLARDEDLHIIPKADQPAVEHPMRRAGQGEPIADDVRTVLLDRSDMGGVDLRPPAAIDQAEPGDGAALIIGPQDDLAENAIADNPRRDGTHSLTALLEFCRCLLFLKAEKRCRVAEAWQHRLARVEAQ